MQTQRAITINQVDDDVCRLAQYLIDGDGASALEVIYGGNYSDSRHLADLLYQTGREINRMRRPSDQVTAR